MALSEPIEQIEIPDIAGTITGWKSFELRYDREDNPYLASPDFAHAWQPGEEYEAVCVARSTSAHRNVCLRSVKKTAQVLSENMTLGVFPSALYRRATECQDQGVEIFIWCARCKSSDCTGKNMCTSMYCQCGFNTYETTGQLIDSCYSRHRVLGEIEMWGQVKVFEKGYRAQRARIGKKLICRDISKGDCAKLAARYNVEIKRLPSGRIQKLIARALGLSVIAALIAACSLLFIHLSQLFLSERKAASVLDHLQETGNFEAPMHPLQAALLASLSFAALGAILILISTLISKKNVALHSFWKNTGQNCWYKFGCLCVVMTILFFFATLTCMSVSSGKAQYYLNSFSAYSEDTGSVSVHAGSRIGLTKAGDVCIRERCHKEGKLTAAQMRKMIIRLDLHEDGACAKEGKTKICLDGQTLRFSTKKEKPKPLPVINPLSKEK